MAAEEELLVSALPAVRRIILAILLLEILVTGTELFRIGHFEDSWQLIPFALLELGLGVSAWQVGRPSYASVRAMKVTMILLVIGGLVGLVLHYRGVRRPGGNGAAGSVRFHSDKPEPATDEGILGIPGVGRKMLHEFKEYRPWKTVQQFRKEIGKYVDAKGVARLERYVAFQ